MIFNELLSEAEKQDIQDQKFLVDILFQIRDYARKNGMEEDDTIRTMCNNMLHLLEIATFNQQED